MPRLFSNSGKLFFRKRLIPVSDYTVRRFVKKKEENSNLKLNHFLTINVFGAHVFDQRILNPSENLLYRQNFSE